MKGIFGRAAAVLIAAAFATSMAALPASAADTDTDIDETNGVVTYTAAGDEENDVFVERVSGGADVFDLIDAGTWWDGNGDIDTDLNAILITEDWDTTDSTNLGFDDADCYYGSLPGDLQAFVCEAPDISRVVVNTLNMDDEVYSDTVSKRVNVNLGGGDDYADTGGEPNAIGGGPGADLALAGGGADSVSGGGGQDELRGQTGNDSLTGGAAQDELYGGDGSDHMYSVDAFRDADFGGAGIDYAHANAFDVVVSARRV